MSAVVTFLFAILWAVIAFALIRYVLGRVFRDARHATIAAGLVVVAYVAGYYSPLASHPQSGADDATHSETAYAPTSAAAAPAAEPVVKVKDISAACHESVASGAKTLGYADSIHDAAAPAESLTSGASVPAGHTLVMSGWAASVSADAPASSICLSLDGKIDVHATVLYGISRPDVAANLKVPALGNTGFTISAPTKSLSKGSHAFAAVETSSNGSTGLLQGSWTIDVR